MLAKLIAWSGTRDQAIQRMLRALGEYHIGGIKSNITLFRAILNDADFRNGVLDTGYLDRLLQHDIEPNGPPPDALAAIAALVGLQQNEKADGAAERGFTGTTRWVALGREDLLR